MQGSSRLVSKFVTTYERLFDGYTPEEISPHEDPARFWSNLLSLTVDCIWLGQKLHNISKDDLMNIHKPFLHILFSTCLLHFQSAEFTDSRKSNSVETLTLVIRCCLHKNLAGWEVMELFAGNVSDSDKVFLNFMKTTDNVLGDTTAPAKLRHQVLQLAITFACGINQLSPGAYLLRRNLVPAITSMINSPDTQAFTFEAVFLLAIVANFHKSDAAKLNPYLRSLKDLDDVAVMKTMCWSANFALYRVIKAYQDISDDSPPTFATSVGSLFASLRPDRALSSTPIDPPRELFKNQPIQASVILLPLYEFVHLNDIFATVLVESILSPPGDIKATNSSSRLPLPHTVLTISSYILTHASSVSSRRAVAYANLCLHILLVAAENDVILSAFSQVQKSPSPVRLCRQRLPLLPILPPAHPLTCALLDCCVLWLKHNLHKRLEVHSYIICIWIVHRVIYFLCKTKSRLEYHWQELWRALLVLLDFLTNKLDGIDSRDGADRLVQETVVLIDFALCHAEAFLESPQAVHQFIYEVVRASSTLQKQKVSLQRSSMTGAARTSQNSRLLSMAFEALKSTTAIAAHYEVKIQASKGSSAAAVLRIIAKDVDRDGVHGGKDRLEDDLIKHSQDIADIGFVRFACVDGLALMPGPE